MDGWSLVAFKLITMAVMATGLLAIFFLPGLLIMWLAALTYGLLTGFNLTSGIIFALITILMLAGSLLDNFIVGASVRRHGASWSGIILALLAVLIVSVFLTPLGGLAAGFVTFFGAEWVRNRSFKKAVNGLRILLVGYGWSFLFALIAGLLIFILWGVWVLWA